MVWVPCAQALAQKLRGRVNWAKLHTRLLGLSGACGLITMALQHGGLRKVFEGSGFGVWELNQLL